MKNKHSITVLFLFLFTLAPAWGDTGFYSEKFHNNLTLTVGTDYSMITLKIGYSHNFFIKEINRHLVLDFNIGMPLLHFDFKDFHFEAGITMESLKYRKFTVPITFRVIGTTTGNSAYDAFSLGTEIGLSPGFRWKYFFIEGEFFWRASWISYMKFSDFYRANVYEKAKDGWYGNTSHSLRLGGKLGFLIKERFEISLRGGWEYHGKYSYNIPGFYVILGSNYKF